MTTLILLSSIHWVASVPAGDQTHKLLAAIRKIETNDREGVVGDGGRAIGPYQIHYSYWKDSGVPGRYEQCRKRAYSERVVRAYWRRYCPRAMASGDSQTLARIHHGGPRGHQKAVTVKYWNKVRAVMRDRSQSSRLTRHRATP